MTEIDVWEGPAGEPVTLEGDKNWRKVATYNQERRDHYSPSVDHCYNGDARYIDGYVDIRGIERVDVETRAIRLRVVQQWIEYGHRELMGVRADRGGRQLDTRRCRVYGVAAVQHIGGEPEVNMMVYERLAVHDGATGKLIKEFPLGVGWGGMGFLPDGRLLSIAGDHRSIVEINTETGATTPVITKFKTPPSRAAYGPDGLVYCYISESKDEGSKTRPFHAYSLDGKLVKEFGEPGKITPGPWVPGRIGELYNICVDSKGSLWAAEGHSNPKRIVRFDTKTGKLTGEFLGNTEYGGGGTFNSFDKSRVFYGRIEYDMDWKNYKSRIRNMMSTDIGEQADIAAIKLKGRTYLATVPLRLGNMLRQVVIYLYDNKTGTARMTAAFGHAYQFGPASSPEILPMLNGKTPLEFTFLWSDLNGNGKVDPDEIKFEPTTITLRHSGFEGGMRLGHIDDQLACVGTNCIYEVSKILPNGTPVFDRKPLKFSPLFRFANGNFLFLNGKTDPKGRTENYALNPAGEKVWGYPVHSPGVGGLSISQYMPGYVSHQFGTIIGHATPDKGELGEFVVVHQNTGQWRIWTADGFLAGEIMRHKFFPGVQVFNSIGKAAPGTRLDPLTVNQEHFSGFVGKSHTDGKFYAVAGFNHISLVEIKGLEKARRVSVDVTVTEADIAKAKAWDEAQEKQVVFARTLQIKAQKLDKAPAIDGVIQQDEWPNATQIRDGNLSFRIAYDNANLYLCWAGKNVGKLSNSGEDFHTLFTSGAALDLFLGINPEANANRREPQAGDLRLLLTFAQGKPLAVLSSPVAPGAKPEEGWRAFSQAAGEITFDRIARLDNVKLAMKEADGGFVAEAAVPLDALGLKIKNDLRLKMDWGMLVSYDGVAVKERVYWANRLAAGTGDVVAEARFMPGAWGELQF